ncbi:DUF4956 domain-containing protein [Candidatus Peregrinibacteria bacterium]|nr:DUF4956 domain-containing protein [Candidatus Peregrinibacteria bacterium]MBI2117832.1 DUF4956 domain-containing protein [Candidatus Peregrinibacteria bacterium]MBI4129199.1 DUF4956 domain-containing protein [Candidatus Peregrinibacteria bacterium]
MQPVIPDVPVGLGVDPVTIGIAFLGSFFLCLVIAFVYRSMHRGLSYSQSFQFSLVLLGMLGAAVMMIASGSIIRAVGLLGAFSLIRFRTAVKDPKDMAYILFVLVVGLAMGAQLYVLAILVTVAVCGVILALTWLNFGMTHTNESIIRLMCKGEGHAGAQTASYEEILHEHSAHFRLLSAHAHLERMELTYGVRPKHGKSSLALLEALRKEKGVEDAELFDAKHQVEF